MLKNSSYPPRMGSEFIKKKLQENKELARANKTKQRGVRRERTDLDRLYREYRDNLEKKQTRQTDKMVVLTEKAELHQREKNKMKHRNQPRETSKKRPRSAEGNLSAEANYNLTTQLRLKLLEEKQLREGFNL